MAAPSAGAVRGQAAIGLLLATAVVGAWLALHVWGVFFADPSALAWWLVGAAIALQTWLGVGLFIVAHDAMHGSLAPGRPRTNAVVGQLCVGLYAAFDYRRLRASHQCHHAAPGTAGDPDFHPERPTMFLPWFVRFFRRYFGWREFGLVTGVLLAYLLLGARPLNLVLFWGLPAILSALQLFVVGTWLPHRHWRGHDPVHAFPDPHRARTLDLPWLASLLACFHFGLHREHHCMPHVPWWRLPAVRL